MKRKKSNLDKIDLFVDPRPMTAEEKKALDLYIEKDQQKRIKGKKKHAA